MVTIAGTYSINGRSQSMSVTAPSSGEALDVFGKVYPSPISTQERAEYAHATISGRIATPAATPATQGHGKDSGGAKADRTPSPRRHGGNGSGGKSR